MITTAFILIAVAIFLFFVGIIIFSGGSGPPPKPEDPIFALEWMSRYTRYHNWASGMLDTTLDVWNLREEIKAHEAWREEAINLYPGLDDLAVKAPPVYTRELISQMYDRRYGAEK
jgi:hypothetical protein